jgi:hypothetical protein
MLKLTYAVVVPHSISHLSVKITSSKTQSRPLGHEYEERKHNLLSTLISDMFLYDVHYNLYEIEDTQFHSS